MLTMGIPGRRLRRISSVIYRHIERFSLLLRGFNPQESAKGREWRPQTIQKLFRSSREWRVRFCATAVLQQKDLNCTLTGDTEKRRKRADAGVPILEIQKRVKPDPEGWTSREYIN